MASVRYLDGKIQLMIELTDEDCMLPHVSHVGDDASIELAFHIKEWQDNFGSGTYTLLIRRPNESASYYVTCTVSGEYATYVLQNSDLQNQGVGKIQLRGEYSNSKKKLTHMWDFEIMESLTGNGTTPSPWDDIIERIEGLAVTAAEEAVEEEATSAANTAVTTKFNGVSAIATTISAGESATASYNASTNTFTFGVPRGDTGATGQGVASGGTNGQFLTKDSTQSSGTAWVDNPVTSSGVTQSDLTKLHNVTSTAAELNILDGATSTTSDLDYLHSLAGASVYASAIKNIFNFVYPVGSIYTSVSSTSPATLFGGTWEQIQGRFLVACGSNGESGAEAMSISANATGGESSHTLTASESGQKAVTTSSSGVHSHTTTVSEDGSHTHKQNGSTVYYGVEDGTMLTSGSYWYGNSSSYSTASAGAHTHTVTIADSTSHTHTIDGADATTSHNNLPPYLGVYMWKRTALAS